MSDLSSAIVFEDGEELNAALLNAFAAGLAVQVGFLTGKSQITPAVGDYFLIYDISGAVLAKCTLAGLITAGLGTSATTAAAGNDSRFSASVNGLRLSTAGGATDTAAKAKDLAFAPTVAAPVAGAVTLDCSLNNLFTIAFVANTTVTLTNVSDGDEICIQITQDGTGSRLLTLVTTQTVLYVGNTAYVLSTAANSIDFLCFKRVGGNLLSWIYKDFGT